MNQKFNEIKTEDIVNFTNIDKPDVNYLSPLYYHNSPDCLLCWMNFSKKLDIKVFIPRVTAAWSRPLPPPLPPHYWPGVVPVSSQ